MNLGAKLYEEAAKKTQSEEEITENEFQTLKIISSFLSKHIEQ